MRRAAPIPALVLAAILPAAAAPTASGLDKVHPAALDAVAGGRGEFLVVLADPATLPTIPDGTPKAERGRIIYETLRRHAARTQAPLRELLDSRGIAYQPFWIVNMLRVEGSAADLELLARRSEVARIDPNSPIAGGIPRPGAGEVGPDTRAVEWGVARINADDVWALGFTGEGVVVGGQDTGYQWNHPALISKYRGWNGSVAVHDYNWHDAIHASLGPCGSNATAPCDDHGHGTHTMGTMVGDDGAANQIGVAPGARWIGCRNMNGGNGTPATYAECFEWFIAPTDLAKQNANPALAPDVINNSWGCPPSEGCSPDTLRQIVEAARAAGIVVVASAGNNGPGCSTVSDPPAIYDASFSIGSTTSADAISSFSSRGPVTIDGSGRPKPDVSAPGSSVRSSSPVNSYTTLSGTSMAGPHVAGAIALLLEARPDLRGRVEEIETLARSSALPLTSTQSCGGVSGLSVPNNTYGAGRIDALAMLEGDADGDGVANLPDCRPLDAAAWGAPSTARDLAIDRTSVSWTASEDPGATTAVYDVFRSATPAGFASSSCLGPGDGGTSIGETSSPAPGSAFFYVVRVRGPCGASAGSDSFGDPRPTPDGCP